LLLTGILLKSSKHKHQTEDFHRIHDTSDVLNLTIYVVALAARRLT